MHPYQGSTAVIATKHGKGDLVAPAFAKILGVSVSEIAVDTDLLGTFSGEVERVGTPIEVAIKKAKIGMAAAGAQIGLASEGSVGPDPTMPFLNSNIEVMVFIDSNLGLEISQVYRSFEITTGRKSVLNADEELGEFLKKSGFPEHKVIVRSANSPLQFCEKEIGSEVQLRAALHRAFEAVPGQEIIIESDLRAHCSPSRQRNIAALAQLLAERISATCPVCATPGWGVVGYENGVKCELCKREVIELAKSEKLGCVKCAHQVAGKLLRETVDPGECQWCNP
jgi:hypothetical protein